MHSPSAYLFKAFVVGDNLVSLIDEGVKLPCRGKDNEHPYQTYGDKYQPIAEGGESVKGNEADADVKKILICNRRRGIIREGLYDSMPDKKTATALIKQNTDENLFHFSGF